MSDIEVVALRDMLSACRDKVASQNVTLIRLRDAIGLYGKHLNECGHFTEAGACTCGLEEVRAL